MSRARSTRNLDMWSTAEPVVREWMERNLGPAGRIEDAAGGVAEVGKFIGVVPGMLTRGAALVEQLDVMTRDGLVLAPGTIAPSAGPRPAAIAG